jgi:hypothetical protein
MSLFKRFVSAEDFATTIWMSIVVWPTKHGSDFKRDFGGSFSRNTEDVLNEVVYFLSFVTNYAFWQQLEKTPEILRSVGDAFITHVNRFADERRCPPIPSGKWMGNSLIWMPGNSALDGGPRTNLERRFDLYVQSLSRREDRSVDERLAHVLAAFCGTMDTAFIAYVIPLFRNRWSAVKDNLGEFKIRD